MAAAARFASLFVPCDTTEQLEGGGLEANYEIGKWRKVKQWLQLLRESRVDDDG